MMLLKEWNASKMAGGRRWTTLKNKQMATGFAWKRLASGDGLLLLQPEIALSKPSLAFALSGVPGLKRLPYRAFSDTFIGLEAEAGKVHLKVTRSAVSSHVHPSCRIFSGLLFTI